MNIFVFPGGQSIVLKKVVGIGEIHAIDEWGTERTIDEMLKQYHSGDKSEYHLNYLTWVHFHILVENREDIIISDRFENRFALAKKKKEFSWALEKHLNE